MNLPIVVDKNDEDGNFCKTENAKVFINSEPIARTVTCKCGGGQDVHHNNMVCVMNEKEKPRIRKLTPKECWRLMGYTDQDFDNAKASGVSNSQLYKQAGNAIVKQVLMAIFKQMLS